MREIKMSQAIEECKRMDITVLPPDINKSDYSFSIENGLIRFGLSAIKNVGQAAIESIIEARDKEGFKSFKDFLSKIDLRKVNKKTVESLVKAGAFLKFGNKATILGNYPEMVLDLQKAKIKQDKGQFDLFDDPKATKSILDNFRNIPEFKEDELFSMEREVIGFLIGKNPMLKYKNIIEKKVTHKIGEITDKDVDKSIIIAGIVSGKKALKTKKDNSEMAVIQIFDDTGTIEVVVFPKSFAKLKQILLINRIIMLKGKVNDRENRLGIIMENAVDLETVNTK